MFCKDKKKSNVMDVAEQNVVGSRLLRNMPDEIISFSCMMQYHILGGKYIRQKRILFVLSHPH